jgi:16S rRNA (cytosine1402-N4)-methyltransferase
MHTPVLLKEVLEIFNPQPGQVYIDATVNGGGHARAIAQRLGAKGKVIGIDWDPKLIEELERRNKESGIKNIELVSANYAKIKKIASDKNIKKVNGILFDLGFSSYHIERSGRGFSFLRDEPLDMRYSSENDLRAEKIINTWSGEAIENVLRTFGEERYARRIASAIVQARRRKKITQTAELAKLIYECVPGAVGSRRIHPATRTFQALRIAVNGELENLKLALKDSVDLLLPGGRLIMISFHSLEDRIVKSFFAEAHKGNTMTLLTPKPLRPSLEEVGENPRARSARLRAAEKLHAGAR